MNIFTKLRKWLIYDDELIKGPVIRLGLYFRDNGVLVIKADDEFVNCYFNILSIDNTLATKETFKKCYFDNVSFVKPLLPTHHVNTVVNFGEIN